jgi:hypothetical protein
MYERPLKFCAPADGAAAATLAATARIIHLFDMVLFP